MTIEKTTQATTINPALAYIQQCAALLDKIEALLPPTDPLTAMDKKRQAKARKGAERYIPQIVSLARQHGVDLALVPLDAITEEAAEAVALVPLQKQLGVLMSRVSNRMFTVQSSSWSGSSKLYAVLKRLSRDEGTIATGLKPVELFFSARHRSVAKNRAKELAAAAEPVARIGATSTPADG